MTPMLSVMGIAQRIYSMRGNQVMLDEDLADLYHVSTKQLNRQASRHSKRFPSDFMFQVTSAEYEFIKSVAISEKVGRGAFRKYLPYAFTAEGVAMLSSVLRSEKAIVTNIAIMRAFVHFRRQLGDHVELKSQIGRLEEKLDTIVGRNQSFTHRCGIEEQLVQRSASDIANYGLGDLSPTLKDPRYKYLLGGSQKGFPEVVPPLVKSIQETMSEYYGVKMRAIRSDIRASDVVLARQVAIFLIRKYCKLSLKKTGSYFSNKDHTTVLHACRKITNENVEGSLLRQSIEQIETSLRAQNLV